MGVIRWGELCLYGSGLIRGTSGRIWGVTPPPPVLDKVSEVKGLGPDLCVWGLGGWREGAPLGRVICQVKLGVR